MTPPARRGRPAVPSPRVAFAALLPTRPTGEWTALLETAQATASEQALDLHPYGYSASVVSTPDVAGFDT